MKKLYFLLVFAVVSLLTVLQGCEKEGSSEFTSEVEIYKYNQLKNIYENEIVALGKAFVAGTKQLEADASTFRANATLSNLKDVQDQWVSVAMVWKQLELYDLGDVADSFIAFEINRWPTDTLRIEDNIAGSDTIDEAFIASIGSSSKGISGMEYLLFPLGNADVLGNFTTAENAGRRLDYLVGMSENLYAKSKLLQALWKAYESEFTHSLESGISGSQNRVINAMVALIEEIVISKLGNPLGETNGGTIDPERLEAYRSGQSKEIIQQHLKALRRCYKGDFAPTSFRVGFDDLLIQIGSQVFADKIRDQYAQCQANLDAIPGTLEEQLLTNPGAVVALRNSFRDLLVLIKVDMANVLGSTITFNDNDGD